MTIWRTHTLRWAQVVCDLVGDLSLHRQHVGELAFVLFAPQLFVFAYIDKFRTYNHRLAPLHNAASQHGPDSEFLSHNYRISLPTFVTKH